MTKPPEDYIERRTRSCHALIEAAELNRIGKFIIGQSLGVPLGGLAAGKIAQISKKWTGGAWIMGGVYLTRDAVSFHPNSVEKLGYDNLEVIRVPLEDIRDVRLASKLLHPAVAIDTENATLWLSILVNRRRFADAVRAAADARPRAETS